MNWLQALKHWNDKKGGKYVIPKKGSKEHAQVMKLMKKENKDTANAKKKGGALETKPKKRGGSIKSKSTVVIVDEPQYTEKALRMKGGAMKKRKQLQVIAGQPQLTYVSGGSLNNGYRSGASDPKLYGLTMFGQ